MPPQVSNGLFMSKLLYGLELFSGANKKLLDKLNDLIVKVAKIFNGREGISWSTSKHLKMVNWLDIFKLKDFVQHKMTHRIINNKKPEELFELMKNPATHVSRSVSDNKLGALPRQLTTSIRSRLSFRSRAYSYNNLPGEITRIPGKITFKSALKNISFR